MKVFMNQGSNGNYYTTSFYHKNQDGTEAKRSVYVGYQKGCEPIGNADYELIARDKDTGAEYVVILDCYRKNEVAEPKLFMLKPKLTEQQAIDNTEKRVEEINREIKIEQDSLPFY